MRRSTAAITTVVAALSFLLGACSGGSSALGNAAKNVEAYVQARVKSDVNGMINLSCAAWEQNARLEATSIEGRNAMLDGLSCEQSGVEGNTAFVSCKGKITTSYEGEQREFDLAERQFKATQEGGEWRMCGYK